MKKSLLKRIMALILAMGLLFSDMSVASAAAPAVYTGIRDQQNVMTWNDSVFTITGPSIWETTKRPEICIWIFIPMTAMHHW